MHRNDKIRKIIVYSPMLFVFCFILFIFFYFKQYNFYEPYIFVMGAFVLFCVYVAARNISKHILHVNKTNAQLQEQNKLLEELLYKDHLTKLPNKKSLQQDLESMYSPKIIIIDIDDFHNINEYYGNDVGDAILFEVIGYLHDFISNTQTKLYRVGSDQFALVEDAILDIERYEQLAFELVSVLKKKEVKVLHKTQKIEINCTIGMALEEENTLSKAFIALDYAKKNQRDFICYMKNLDTKTDYAKQIKLASTINEAIIDGRIVPYFQPIFDKSQQANKYECLARMISKDAKEIGPIDFLETSKSVHQYTKIAKILIKKAFTTIQNTDKSVSINLLARDMSDSDVSNYVLDKIAEHGVAKQVVIEILEDENIENLMRISSFLDRARRMGVRIAIDDFGTGYSNFSYLLQLQPDYIKIDGSLIKHIDTDKNSVAIVTAIIVFAKQLGIKTIAEYVCTKEVYEKCKELGVDEFQGFYLGKPLANLL
ncbi:MAG: EAL domain-containing protein [Sulfurospirillum sp.]|nr:EAL domain-containing protein [Sulfurospirillum sp.]